MRAGDGHHHLSSSNIVSFDKLEAMFTMPDGAGEGGGGGDIVGKRHRALLDEFAAIAEFQWRSGSPRGVVKGFLLSGPPGTGKTTLAKRLAYELGRRFYSDIEPSIALAFVDGGEISRSRYGESEERIRDIFVHARSGFTAGGQRSVLLFDDVESIFMARGSTHAKEWHFSQDSVFFHAVDDLDCSKSIVVLTTNRPDIVDEAIRDRFLQYEVGYPDLETLLQLIEQLPALAQASPDKRAALREQLIVAVREGSVRSLRDAQRFALRTFVAGLLERESMASFG
jgi:SpoVK/Ycf46/Vps4 family AAA+-type ATPase